MFTLVIAGSASGELPHLHSDTLPSCERCLLHGIIVPSCSVPHNESPHDGMFTEVTLAPQLANTPSLSRCKVTEVPIARTMIPVSPLCKLWQRHWVREHLTTMVPLKKVLHNVRIKLSSLCALRRALTLNLLVWV